MAHRSQSAAGARPARLRTFQRSLARRERRHRAGVSASAPRAEDQLRIVYAARSLGGVLKNKTQFLRSLCAVAFALFRTRLELFAVGYQQTVRLIQADTKGCATVESQDADVEKICELVNKVGGRLRSACLERSLAAQRVLGKRGVDTAVLIGVRRDSGGEFRAHAWLEHDGRVINDDRAITDQFQTIHDEDVVLH